MLQKIPGRRQKKCHPEKPQFWCALFLFILLFFVTEGPFAETQSVSPFNEEILQGIGYIYNWEFDRAESLFARLIQMAPENPMGHFYYAMVSWSRLISGMWTEEMVKQYRRRIHRTIDVAKEAVKKNEDDCFAYFYLGGALGFEGRFKLTEEKYLSSFFLARDAIKALKTSQQICPDNLDILFGLGTFDYYTARLSGVLKFLSYLLIHRGDKEEGLRKLHIAAESATYSNIEAKSLLLHTYLFMEDEFFDKALVLALDLTRRFPDNPRFKYLEGIAYIQLDNNANYRDMLNFFQEKGSQVPSKNEAFLWRSHGVYLEVSDDLFHNRSEDARSKLKTIMTQVDPASTPFMVAWPLLKTGMSYDLEGQREKALDFYQEVLDLENAAGAQFLAERYKRNSVKPKDPFIGY